MQKAIRYSDISATIPVWLLSAAILISGIQLNVAQAKNRHPKKSRATVAVACGNELTNQCNGVPVHGNNMLECTQKDQAKLSKGCAALANHIVRSCERDAVQRCQPVVAVAVIFGATRPPGVRFPRDAMRLLMRFSPPVKARNNSDPSHMRCGALPWLRASVSCPHHVRFFPIANHIAGITLHRRRANNGHSPEATNWRGDIWSLNDG